MSSLLRELDRLKTGYAALLLEVQSIDALMTPGDNNEMASVDTAALSTAKRLTNARQLFVPSALAEAERVRQAIKEIDDKKAQRNREISGRQGALKRAVGGEEDARDAVRTLQHDLAAAERERDRRTAALEKYRKDNSGSGRLGRSGVFDSELLRLIKAKNDQKNILRGILAKRIKEQARLASAIRTRILLRSDIRALTSKIEALVRTRMRLLRLSQ